MSNQLLSVGTVILYQSKKYMICGYTWDTVEDKMVMKYVCLPYPQGYMKRYAVLTVQSDEIEVVQKGYEDERFSILEKYYSTINSLAQKFSAVDMEKYLDEARNINQLEGEL